MVVVDVRWEVVGILEVICIKHDGGGRRGEQRATKFELHDDGGRRGEQRSTKFELEGTGIDSSEKKVP